MPYTEPTLADFRERFPEFSPVSDELVQLALDDSIIEIGASWHERDRARAQLFLAAHQLASAGEPMRSRSLDNMDATFDPQAGAISSMKVGDVSLSFAKRASVLSGSADIGMSEGDYLGTAYGASFYRLLRKNFPSLRTV